MLDSPAGLAAQTDWPWQLAIHEAKCVSGLDEDWRTSWSKGGPRIRLLEGTGRCLKMGTFHSILMWDDKDHPPGAV